MAQADEFNGPFPSWRNLKSDYGAVGDGKADDTARLQQALDDLVVHTNSCVLYIPDGHYRLTSTVKTFRKKHTDCLGIAVVGESAKNTVLQWDGAAGETIFQYDAWYSKISRLTIDGAGRAAVGLCYGPDFSTYNETSDLVFQNTAIGLLLGDKNSQGQAENEVLRCHFLHCVDAGIKTSNFNCMDIWVWYSRFEDCGHALFNNAGNFHAWQDVFLRSTVADVGSWNLMVFSFVNNTSAGSKRFLDFSGSHIWGSPMTISGNRILNPTANFPLKLGNGGPYLVMDNVFDLAARSPNQAVKMTWGDQTFVGNTYTMTNAVLEMGRFHRVAEKMANAREIDTSLPEMPPEPGSEHRKTFEIPRGSDDHAIQQALNAAARFCGQRPVVHLPMGVYNIARTLVIPAESDVQLVGDCAVETGTRLSWTGPAGGVLLKLNGPTRATLRDLYLDASRASAMLVENADQPGGKIFADQLNVNGPQAKTKASTGALYVNGLADTDVLFRCLQGGGNSGSWVEVSGPAGAAKGQTAFNMAPPARNQISIFNGATGSAECQYDVRNRGELVVRGVYHERSTDSLRGICLADSGLLAIDACRFSCKTSPRLPLVALKSFHGLFTIATSMLMPSYSTYPCRFELSGTGGATCALALGDLFWAYADGVTSGDVWLNRASPPIYAGLIGCNLNSNRNGLFKDGFGFLKDVWVEGAGRSPGVAEAAIPDAALLRHLAPLRNARTWLPENGPAHVTDLRIYRVMAAGVSDAVVEFRAAQ